MEQLQAQDFEIFKDGVPQKISFFDRDQLPLSVVLLTGRQNLGGRDGGRSLRPLEKEPVQLGGVVRLAPHYPRSPWSQN